MKTLALSVLIALLAGAASAPGSPVEHGGDWPSSTPEEQGMDGRVIEALSREFAGGRHGYVDGMLIIRHGHVVFEASYRHDYAKLFEGKGPGGMYNYYDPDWHPYYRGSDLHTLQSVSKSVTSALVGIAIARGELPGVDAKVSRYFEGFRVGEDPRRARTTLRHLLTMTSGIEWDEKTVSYTDPRNSCAAMEASTDWVQYVLDRPMAREPGEVFVYNSGVTVLLAQVLRSATGMQADDYAASHLLRPLGIERSYWKRTPTGVPDTEGGLYLAPRDLAKIGALYLSDGVWNGRRLLPEGWARESTAPRVETEPDAPRPVKYGYQWWALPDPKSASYPAFAAWGYGGQFLIVVPDEDVVAVFTGWNIYDKPSLSPLVALDRVLAAVRPPAAPRAE